MASAQKLFIVGTNGAVLLSSNDGTDWEVVPTPAGAGADLNAVQFPTTSTGYIVGDSGLVLRTVDGGASWVRLVLSPGGVTTFSANLRAMHFVSELEGWVVGDGATLLHTTNGATSDAWDVQAGCGCGSKAALGPRDVSSFASVVVRTGPSDEVFYEGGLCALSSVCLAALAGGLRSTLE